jgi:hypothetical protein
MGKTYSLFWSDCYGSDLYVNCVDPIVDHFMSCLAKYEQSCESNITVLLVGLECLTETYVHVGFAKHEQSC